MARTPFDLGSGQVSTTATTLVTSDLSTKTIIRRITFYNTSTTAAIEVKVYRVASGGTLGDAGSQLVTRSVQFGKSWVCAEVEGHTLNAGESIQATAGTAATVDYNVSGTKVT